MTELDDVKRQFEKKLDEAVDKHKEGLAHELDKLNSGSTPGNVNPPPAKSMLQFNQTKERYASKGILPEHFLDQVDISRDDALRTWDARFRQEFGLSKVYPLDKLDLPTIYCETWKDFTEPFLKSKNLSPAIKEYLLDHPEEAGAEGALGVFLPGIGCYINGEFIKSLYKLEEEENLKKQETAIHEKLGHGFLSSYSALGLELTELNMDNIRIAEKFGIRQLDDPKEKLKMLQYNFILRASQYTEEGYSTWIENFLMGRFAQQYKWEEWKEYFTEHNLTRYLKERTRTRHEEINDRVTNILTALDVIFKDDIDLLDPTQRRIIKSLEILKEWDLIKLPIFCNENKLRGAQSMPYVLGGCLLSMAEANLGAFCMPYVALVAENVRIDTDKIGLNDLGSVLTSDWHYYPDARLVMISRLELGRTDDLNEMVEMMKIMKARLSMSVPCEFSF